MGVRLKDVALRAGVSVKTVSNVVNDYAHVTDETRGRVRQAIDELNYRPNLSARNLRKGRSGIVALALPQLDAPYFAEFARCVIEAAEEHDWTVLLDQTDGLAERERLVTAGIRSHLVDGVILSPLALTAEDLAEHRDETPLVLLGERVYHGPADHVAIDNVAAARTAVEHLVRLGRRRIAAVGDQPDATNGTARLRLEGYRQALAAAGLPDDEQLVVPTEVYDRADGARAMGRLLALEEVPDAVFCFTDLLAIGALRAAHEHGVDVPGQVAVVGVDDIQEGRFSVPTLTTVAPDKEQLARLAVDLLRSRMDGARDLPPRELQAGFRLVVRESTAVGR